MLDNIVNSDPDLRAALASIRADTNGMRNNFERSVAFLLPVCPYAKYSKGRNTNTAIISDVTLLGKGSSKTGVDFRWHTKAEYAKLTKERKEELYKWQRTKQGKAIIKAGRERLNNNAKSNKNMTRKQLHAKIASLEQSIAASSGGDNINNAEISNASGLTLDQVKAMIAMATSTSMREDESKKRGNDNDPNIAATLAIQQIMKRSKS